MMAGENMLSRASLLGRMDGRNNVAATTLKAKGSSSQGKGSPGKELRQSLREQLKTISESCNDCRKCVRECKFLQKYGTPKSIASAYDHLNKLHQAVPFECSLCKLCNARCPEKIDPADMFLEMRRQSFSQGDGFFTEHSPIRGYEKRGTSEFFSYYALPEGCDTIFFPGCTLSGTRPDKVIKVYEHLKKTIPTLGIVFDCCTKPSHDLGDEELFNAIFTEMRDYLCIHGVRTVLVACPNCYRMFKNFGCDISVRTVYEYMQEHGIPVTSEVSGTITIHDPCVIRYEAPIQNAVRNLASKKGLAIEEMPHSGGKTLCCGEGGSVGFLSPEFPKSWGEMRKKEAGNRTVITYCAGCVNFLSPYTPTHHVLDLLFEPEATMAGKVAVSKAPMTYWNRKKLKDYFRKNVDAAASRERKIPQSWSLREKSKKGSMIKGILFIAFIITAIVAIKVTGATRYLEQETLRNAIEDYSTLAPIIYMLIYAIAPALFLPALPITIVGGILFGPLWGVIYAITGSTAGACVAFLISRYLAREWVEGKLKSPRWQRLDQDVERNGWKVVAVTRLIPLFPFNVLNYAFGLTNIKFHHYAVTTFFAMLPACIAFIVFSSSLLDLIKGKVSPTFVLGIALIILVSMIPALSKRRKAKRELKRLNPS
jgi:uncharacterized membrane protein YdjX (TVP38/TMEM64 family)/Fe-S oxidoreductase